MKVTPIITDNIVSQYTRQINLSDQVHNIQITHKDYGRGEKIEEVVRIYDKKGQVKELGRNSTVDFYA